MHSQKQHGNPPAMAAAAAAAGSVSNNKLLRQLVKQSNTILYGDGQAMSLMTQTHSNGSNNSSNCKLPIRTEMQMKRKELQLLGWSDNSHVKVEETNDYQHQHPIKSTRSFHHHQQQQPPLNYRLLNHNLQLHPPLLHLQHMSLIPLAATVSTAAITSPQPSHQTPPVHTRGFFQCLNRSTADTSATTTTTRQTTSALFEVWSNNNVNSRSEHPSSSPSSTSFNLRNNQQTGMTTPHHVARQLSHIPADYEDTSRSLMIGGSHESQSTQTQSIEASQPSERLFEMSSSSLLQPQSTSSSIALLSPPAARFLSRPQTIQTTRVRIAAPQSSHSLFTSRVVKKTPEVEAEIEEQAQQSTPLPSPITFNHVRTPSAEAAATFSSIAIKPFSQQLLSSSSSSFPSKPYLSTALLLEKHNRNNKERIKMKPQPLLDLQSKNIPFSQQQPRNQVITPAHLMRRGVAVTPYIYPDGPVNAQIMINSLLLSPWERSPEISSPSGGVGCSGGSPISLAKAKMRQSSSGNLWKQSSSSSLSSSQLTFNCSKHRGSSSSSSNYSHYIQPMHASPRDSTATMTQSTTTNATITSRAANIDYTTGGVQDIVEGQSSSSSTTSSQSSSFLKAKQIEGKVRMIDHGLHLTHTRNRSVNFTLSTPAARLERMHKLSATELEGEHVRQNSAGFQSLGSLAKQQIPQIAEQRKQQGSSASSPWKQKNKESKSRKDNLNQSEQQPLEEEDVYGPWTMNNENPFVDSVIADSSSFLDLAEN